MDYAIAAAFGSVTDVFATGAMVMGINIGLVVAIAWIKADQ